MQLLPAGAGAGTGVEGALPPAKEESAPILPSAVTAYGMAIGTELVAQPGAALRRPQLVLVATLAPSP